MPEISDKLFEIVRASGERKNKSILMPAAACLIGTFFIEDFANPGLAKLADGTQATLGAVTRDVIVGVPLPTIGELAGGLIGLPAVSPDGQSLISVGFEEYIAEGPDYIYSAGGANDLTTATAVGTKCSYRAGKTAKATTGDFAEFVIQEQLTPLNIGNAYGTGSPRLRLRRVAGVIV